MRLASIILWLGVSSSSAFSTLSAKTPAFVGFSRQRFGNGTGNIDERTTQRKVTSEDSQDVEVMRRGLEGRIGVAFESVKKIGEAESSVNNYSKDLSGLSRRNILSNAVGMASFALMCSFNVEQARSLELDASIVMADSVKTLDMSLPSYNDISDVKASVGTVQGLATEIEEPKEKPKREKREPRKRDDSGGNNMMGNVLPSLNKGNGNKPKPKPTPKEKPAPREKKEKPAKAPEYETMDMALPSYGDSTAPKEKGVFSL